MKRSVEGWGKRGAPNVPGADPLTPTQSGILHSSILLLRYSAIVCTDAAGAIDSPWPAGQRVQPVNDTLLSRRFGLIRGLLRWKTKVPQEIPERVTNPKIDRRVHSDSYANARR